MRRAWPTWNSCSSDFSVVRISDDNSEFDVLGSAGLYIGGNDFDHKLSFFELSRLFGNWETLELNGLPAPSGPYSTLSDWKSLNKLYTRETQKQISWMILNSPNSKAIRAFDHLVRNHEAHAGVSPDQVTDIVMVGGSTFIPLVQARLAGRFGNATLSANDRFGAVAKGLARHGAATGKV